jgi:hypothetical protein
MPGMAKLYSRALREVAEELDEKLRKYGGEGGFSSAHEAYAHLLEEVRELEREVFKSPKKRRNGRMRREAVQVAAMAVRFVMEGCEK